MTEAVLLVGGRGTRLRPLTVRTPKPLLPVAGSPLIAHQLALLAAAGVAHVVLATGYRAELFTGAFGDGSDLGVRLDYATETQPLGTGGAIRNAAPLLESAADEPVLVFNGDILSGVDPGGLLRWHRSAGSAVTLHLTRVADPRAFGLVPTDETGRVSAFLEKPARAEDIVTDQVNAGCYVFRRELIDAIPAGRPVSVERETFPALLAAGVPLSGRVEEGYWMDVGTPEALIRASGDLVLGRVTSPLLAGRTGDRLLAAGAEVAGDAAVTGGSAVGPGAVVASRAVVDGCVLMAGAVVGAGARLRASVVGAGARVGAGTVLDGAVIGDGARVGARNELRAGVRVWCDAVLGDGVVRFSSDL